MFSFAAFGNDLHSGKRSFAFVGKRRIWYAIAVAMTLLSILSLALIRLNPGIEFRGARSSSSLRSPTPAPSSAPTRSARWSPGPRPGSP